MVLETIRTHGVVYMSQNLPANTTLQGPVVSHYIIRECLAAPSKTIHDSPEYQSFLNCGRGSWVGPAPHDSSGSRIHEYLWFHSDRKGMLGQLCGLIYRVIEGVREFFGARSDRLRALDEIQDLLHQAQKLATRTYNPGPLAGLIPTISHIPEDVKIQSQQMLAHMLGRYNEIIRPTD